MIIIQLKLDINMGKNYKMYESDKKDEFPKDKFMEDLCAANGTYCLVGCTYKENKSCKRLELRKKENRK